MATDTHVLHLLDSISVDELIPAQRYRCRRCKREWQYHDGPNWWRCPLRGCASFLDGTTVPALLDAVRVLSGRRPQSDVPAPPPRESGRGGRPRLPKVPQKIMDAAFRRLLKEYGHYPPDADLAAELGVHKSTIANWRERGYLPPRPPQ